MIHTDQSVGSDCCTFCVDSDEKVTPYDEAVNSKNSVVNEYETVGGSSVNNTDYVDMNIEVTESFFASNKVNIYVKKDGEDVSWCGRSDR